MTEPTRQELLDQIERKKQEIIHLQSLIEQCTDTAEKRRMQRQVMELQYLQLWRMDLLKNWDNDK